MNDIAPIPPGGAETPEPQRLAGWLRNLWRMVRRGRNSDSSVRDTLEELIEERAEADQPINDDERLLLANILELRVRTVHDVMVPRADIVAVDLETMHSHRVKGPIDEVEEWLPTPSNKNMYE